jgi:hypothetical protein
MVGGVLWEILDEFAVQFCYKLKNTLNNKGGWMRGGGRGR